MTCLPAIRLRKQRVDERVRVVVTGGESADVVERKLRYFGAVVCNLRESIGALRMARGGLNAGQVSVVLRSGFFPCWRLNVWCH